MSKEMKVILNARDRELAVSCKRTSNEIARRTIYFREAGRSLMTLFNVLTVAH